MTKYKAPETRIVVETKEGRWDRYYPQYKTIGIPYIYSEWRNIGMVGGFDYTCTLEDAQERVDGFLTRDRDIHEEIERKKATKKVKVKYEYLKYP